MSSRPSSYTEGNTNRGSRRDGEKASKPYTHDPRDGRVNNSTRLHSGASSRAQHFDGYSDSMSRSSHGAPPSRSPRRRRSRSPYRAPRSNRHSASKSPSRSRSGSRSPSASSRRGLNDRLRSRSPPRRDGARTGDKRPGSSNHYQASNHSDPRRFKVHFEKEREGTHRGRGQAALGNTGGYDRADMGILTHRGRDDDRLSRDENDTHPRNERDRKNYHAPSNERVTGSLQSAQNSDKASDTAASQASSQSAHNKNDEASQNSQSAAPQASVESEQAADDVEAESTPQLTEDEIIQERRKKRAAIMASFKDRPQPPLLVQALQQNTLSTPSTPHHASSNATSEHASSPKSLDSPRTPASPGSPASIGVANDEDLANPQPMNATSNDDEGPSAADYDPNMEEDRPDHKPFAESTQAHNDATKPEPTVKVQDTDKEFDMFAEDNDDDMFAPAGATTKGPGHAEIRALDSSLLDNWDYPDGHYRIIIGELLDGRYAVQQQIGKGTFATVVRAHDTKTNTDVAIKIACNNETMRKAGTKEMDMLTLLNSNDPDDSKCVIRLRGNFDHKNHMCLVFENLNSDLREVLKKFGRNVGINIKAVRRYAREMFLALGHLKKCEVLHADLKPDNILVNHDRSHLKICDLGTASKAEDAEVTPYLVSRFYRAPEVILGMPFDYAIDMWSIGCTLYELYTGRILFAGSDNNQMLRVIQECRGKFPKRVLIRSTLADKHFVGGDPEFTFYSQERDKITGNQTMKPMNFTKIPDGKDLKARLTANARSLDPEEVKELHHFVDLLDKCLQLDPAKRISPRDALYHPFIKHPLPKSTTATTKVKPAMAPLRMK